MLPEDLLKEAIPGNIRKAEHFVAFLKRFVEYLKVCHRGLMSMALALLTLLMLGLFHHLRAEISPDEQTGIQTRMRVLHVVAETPLSFLQHLKDITYIERRPLRYVRKAVP